MQRMSRAITLLRPSRHFPDPLITVCHEEISGRLLFIFLTKIITKELLYRQKVSTMTTLTSTSSGSDQTKFPWGKSDGSSLTEHIRSCLVVFNELKVCIPLLNKTSRTENFWKLLFWAICLHDFGKLHPEF